MASGDDAADGGRGFMQREGGLEILVLIVAGAGVAPVPEDISITSLG